MTYSWCGVQTIGAAACLTHTTKTSGAKSTGVAAAMGNLQQRGATISAKQKQKKTVQARKSRHRRIVHRGSFAPASHGACRYLRFGGCARSNGTWGTSRTPMPSSTLGLLPVWESIQTVLVKYTNHSTVCITSLRALLLSLPRPSTVSSALFVPARAVPDMMASIPYRELRCASQTPKSPGIPDALANLVNANLLLLLLPAAAEAINCKDTERKRGVSPSNDPKCLQTASFSELHVCTPDPTQQTPSSWGKGCAHTSVQPEGSKNVALARPSTLGG